MTKQTDKRLPQATLASVEADLFGAIYEFHKKTTTLLRRTSLDDKKLSVVSGRIKTLLDNVTAEVKQAQQLNLAQRLEAAYDDVERLVDELAA